MTSFPRSMGALSSAAFAPANGVLSRRAGFSPASPYGSLDENGELPPILTPPNAPGGGIGGGILRNQPQGQLEVPQDASVDDLAGDPSQTARSFSSPFSKANLSQTLLGIGQGFLSNPDSFWKGLGAAGGAISDRIEKLNPTGKRKITYGGPENQFEITENPDGTRSVRKVPEFAQAAQAAQADKRRLTTKDSNDTVNRAVAAISRLDTPEKRASAYNFLLQRPAEFGLTADDVTGLPQEWSDTYGTVRGQMGYSLPQYEANQDRDRAFA